MNVNGYNDVLKKGLLQIYGRNVIFQQDNALCHKSRVVSSFMNNYGICCLSDWPPQSPDLNIIESLWSDLKGNVAKYRPANTLEDLSGKMGTDSCRKNKKTVRKITSQDCGGNKNEREKYPLLKK